MAAANIHIGEATRQITLHVRGLRGFGFRLWVAAQMFKLGARIAGVGIVMESGDGATDIPR